MKHIFYLLTLLPLTYELVCFWNLKKTHEFVKRMKNIKWDDCNTNQKLFSSFNFFYLLYVIIGIFSTQWIEYLLLLLLTFLPNKFILIRIINTSFSLILLIFIILNVYHFHINLDKILYNWIFNK